MQHLVPRWISRCKSLRKTVYLYVRNTDTVHSLQWDMEKLNLFMFHYNNMRNLQPEHIKFWQESKRKLPQSETVKWVHYFGPIFKYNYSFSLLWRANSGIKAQLFFHQNDRWLNGEHLFSDSYWRKENKIAGREIPLGSTWFTKNPLSIIQNITIF
jgi:hypothetical protein